MRSAPTTIPGLFLQAVERFGPRVALRKKQLGIWKEVTWNEYYQHVHSLYHGLKKLGIARGDIMGIVSENRPEWLYAAIACQCLGALPLGVHADLSAAELECLLSHNQVRYLVLEDQEQADKIMTLGHGLSTLDRCIVLEWAGMEDYDHPLLIAYEAVERLGREQAEKRPESFRRDIAAIAPTDIAFLYRAFGTTDPAQTVRLGHQAVLERAVACSQIERCYPADELMSYVSLASPIQRCFSIIFPLMTGYRVNFPESADPNTMAANMREICPSIFNSTGNDWEGIYAGVCRRRADTTWLKRKLFAQFVDGAGGVVERTSGSARIPRRLSLLQLLGNLLLYRKIRERLGFRLLRCAYTSGGVIGPEASVFYHKIGIDIRRIDCLTQIDGICAAHSPDRADPTTLAGEGRSAGVTLSEGNLP